jgi:hypothetical protein
VITITAVLFSGAGAVQKRSRRRRFVVCSLPLPLDDSITTLQAKPRVCAGNLQTRLSISEVQIENVAPLFLEQRRHLLIDSSSFAVALKVVFIAVAANKLRTADTRVGTHCRHALTRHWQRMNDQPTLAVTDQTTEILLSVRPTQASGRHDKPIENSSGRSEHTTVSRRLALVGDDVCCKRSALDQLIS